VPILEWPSSSATIQIKHETTPVRAEQASPEDKARLWPEMTKVYATYDEYQKKTSRQIPLVILKPAAGS
jgi:hypothetical protein